MQLHFLFGVVGRVEAENGQEGAAMFTIHLPGLAAMVVAAGEAEGPAALEGVHHG